MLGKGFPYRYLDFLSIKLGLDGGESSHLSKLDQTDERREV